MRRGLGRHVEHDPRSRRYAFRRTLPVTSVQHTSHIGVLDQGAIGACTGFAAVGCLGYTPFRETLDVDLDNELGLDVYSQATRLDQWEGQWPPDDTGSSGLAAAKAVQSRGYISGYLHTFTFGDALGALMQRPLIVGSNWYEAMFWPSPDGMVSIGGPVAGGHEYILDGWDETRGVASFRNSWGPLWGRSGSFRMAGETLSRLLSEDGDAIMFTPATEPAPEPTDPVEPSGCLTTLLRGLR